MSLKVVRCLKKIPENVGIALDVGSEQCCNNFEKDVRESINYIGLLLVEIWILSILLLRAQKDMNNMLLETGGRRIFLL